MFFLAKFLSSSCAIFQLKNQTNLDSFRLMHLRLVKNAKYCKIHRRANKYVALLLIILAKIRRFAQMVQFHLEHSNRKGT